MSAPTLLVLAAGMGSRYGGLKQVVPVNDAGDAIVDYSVFDAVRAGFGRVVFVIRKAIEEPFKTAVGSRLEQHVPVDYAFQELDCLPPGFTVPQGRTKPWGTLHAALVGAEKIEGSFAVINADDFYGAESYRVLAQHLQSDTVNCAMIGFTLRNTLSDFGPVSRGICSVDRDGLLLGTLEKTSIVRSGEGARSVGEDPPVSLSGDEIVSMNMWGFVRSAVPLLARDFHHFLEACGDRSQGGELPSQGGEPHRVGRAGAGRCTALQRQVVRCDLPRGSRACSCCHIRADTRRTVPREALAVTRANTPDEVLRHFCMEGSFVSALPHGSGHINQSYCVSYDEGGQVRRYLLQRVNTAVFKQPELLMDNVQRVTSHLAGKVAGQHDADRRVLKLVHTRDGSTWHRDADGRRVAACSTTSRTRSPTMRSRRRTRRLRLPARSAAFSICSQICPCHGCTKRYPGFTTQ